MTKVRLVAFDLDDTLAPSKSAISAEMAESLCRLLEVTEVLIISGGQWKQFKDQVLTHLYTDPAHLSRLHIMPTCGTRYLRHDGEEWRTIYEQPLRPRERDAAITLLEREARRLGLWEEDTWGEVIEDRGTQITFSALGQSAPIDAKRAWDPTGEKRSAIVGALEPLLPDLEIRSGGSTSVDITRKGIDKAYGMLRLSEQTGIPLDEMVFVGDRLDPEGNDYPVKKLGVASVDTTGPEQTVEIIDELMDGMVARCAL
ncbi:MAG TPA: HAD-IIB family hydrolase [Actinomycetaceae bacterium]|nr:HAD-IIB family hydrolase [Actinomycetaceae bacterium]